MSQLTLLPLMYLSPNHKISYYAYCIYPAYCASSVLIQCLLFSLSMCAVLGHGHGHSHGGGGHGHSHGGKKSKRHGHSHSSDLEEGNSALSRFKRKLRRKKTKQDNAENINVRAAFVHVIGDLIQSIGVVIAGYIIWIRVSVEYNLIISNSFIAIFLQPDWKLADPICTFLFCILVLFSTINVLKDALRVLMEGTFLQYNNIY